MLSWGQTSALGRCALLTVLFLILCVQLFGLLRGFEHRGGRHWRGAGAWFLLLLVGFLALYDLPVLGAVPVWALWCLTALSALEAGAGLFFSTRGSRQRVTRASIKEGMDDLPMAGCYFTERGTVKLCNRQMLRLFHAMTGRDLQTLEELRTALADCPDRGIGRLRDGGYIFPDGSVWYYAERETAAADGRRYTEAILTSGTELSAANGELERDNRELLRVNEKLQRMYARAEDRIREREYLTFKMKIHDDIGQSLSVLREALRSGAGEDLERQLKKLSLAAGTLVYSPHAGSGDPYDALLAQAAELGVEIKLDGMLPMEPAIYDLVVRAIRECLTNCVRHAHGTAVFVRIAGIPQGYTVTITNDGQRPQGPIREGGGLATLRRSIESAGGEMALSYYPEFLLRFTLTREEMEL